MSDCLCCTCGACFTVDLPALCPYCGSPNIMGALPGTGDPFLVMESAQQRGLWDRARNLLEQYRHEGAIDDSNYTLSNAQIQWRSDCVNRMKELQEIHTGDDLREILYSEFDSFAADWVLDVYKG